MGKSSVSTRSTTCAHGIMEANLLIAWRRAISLAKAAIRCSSFKVPLTRLRSEASEV
jgi:hypothetical protein